jgi:hypothetical protein
MSERGVALFHRSRVTNPKIGETMFHVEHDPIHPSAPAKATFLNELVNAGINDLDRKRLG